MILLVSHLSYRAKIKSPNLCPNYLPYIQGTHLLFAERRTDQHGLKQNFIWQSSQSFRTSITLIWIIQSQRLLVMKNSTVNTHRVLHLLQRLAWQWSSLLCQQCRKKEDDFSDVVLMSAIKLQLYLESVCFKCILQQGDSSEFKGSNLVFHIAHYTT